MTDDVSTILPPGEGSSSFDPIESSEYSDEDRKEWLNYITDHSISKDWQRPETTECTEEDLAFFQEALAERESRHTYRYTPLAHLGHADGLVPMDLFFCRFTRDGNEESATYMVVCIGVFPNGTPDFFGGTFIDNYSDSEGDLQTILDMDLNQLYENATPRYLS